MATIARFVDSIGEIFAPVSDTFTRTVSDGWGTSDSGETYEYAFEGGSTVAYFDVGSGVGTVTIAAVSAPPYALLPGTYTDADIRARVKVPVTATGDSLEWGFPLRFADTGNFLLAQFRFDTTGNIDVVLTEKVTGVFTTVASATNVMAYTPDTYVNVRVQMVGALYRMKVWTGTEPATWTTAGISPTYTSGKIGVRSLAFSGNTNTLPLTMTIDDLTVNPLVNVRMDLNDGTLWRLLGTSRFDPPRAKRARVSTLLADGAIYPASAYDDRMLELRWLLQGDTTDIVNAEIRKLAVELNRASNVFEYRPEGATESVFFRSHRLGLDALDVPTDGTQAWVEVNVPAEPFGYGLREVLPSVTVNNDPAAATNPQQFDVAGVLGDVDTPPIMRLPGATVSSKTSLIAVRSRETPGFYALQCESGTMGTDTSVQANDVLMSGAGSNYVRTTFVTNTNMVNRITFTAAFPVGARESYRGRYRVLLRHRKSVAGPTVQARLRWGGTLTSDSIAGDTVILDTGTNIDWADLGVFSLPPSPDPVVDGYSGLPLPVAGVTMALQAERLSGATTLDPDVLVFVPCDERFAYVRWATILGAFPALATVDGPRELAYGQNSDLSMPNNAGVGVTGVFPTLAPGVTNRVYLMPTIGEGDAVSTTVPVTVEYWPRYLWVRSP